MQQAWIKLRGAIFAESGFCLSAPQLKRDATGYFLTKSIDGATRGLDPIPGCDGDSADPASATCVQLQPFPDQEAARKALMLMCCNLGAAVEGDEQARGLLGGGWLKMLTDGLRLTQQSEPMQLELLKNLYGSGRILDELNRKGTLAFMPELDVAAMLDEALPVAA